MNLDSILTAMNDEEVSYMLIGGMNFLLRHEPVLTYDVDLWIKDTPQNLAVCEKVLASLDAAWGPSEDDWKPTSELEPGWLTRQAVFSLTSPHGAIDIFRAVQGLDDWQACFDRCEKGQTSTGATYFGLSDADMLTCQEALDDSGKKMDRIRALRSALDNSHDSQE